MDEVFNDHYSLKAFLQNFSLISDSAIDTIIHYCSSILLLLKQTIFRLTSKRDSPWLLAQLGFFKKNLGLVLNFVKNYKKEFVPKNRQNSPSSIY